MPTPINQEIFQTVVDAYADVDVGPAALYETIEYHLGIEEPETAQAIAMNAMDVLTDPEFSSRAGEYTAIYLEVFRRTLFGPMRKGVYPQEAYDSWTANMESAAQFLICTAPGALEEEDNGDT